MYIPELDALIFLATDFLEGDADQPTLESGIKALHEAAGTTYTPSQTPKRSKVSDRLARRGCIDLLEQLGVPLQDDILPVVWEALGGVEDVAVITVGLLIALVCQAEFDAKAAFIFWLLDKDGDHRLTKGDVLGAVGPLMHTAQAGIVFMGSAESDCRNAASIWEDFKDSMRELATDQVAAAIATGAFDEVDVAHTGKIQEAQFRVMIECVATDVATMMVNVTEMQGQVERVSGTRLDSSNSPATGVKTALHKLVTKYAGGEVAEKLLGAPAKQRRKSGASGSRPPRFGSSTTPQQTSRFSPLRSRAGSVQTSNQASAPSSRQNSGQLQRPGLGLSPLRSQPQWQSSSVLGSPSSQPQQHSTLGLSSQSSQPGSNSLLTPQSSQPQWQSNLAYSPHNSMTQQQSTASSLPQSTITPQASAASGQQITVQGVRLTSTPRFPVNSAAPDSAPDSSVQQPGLESQGPSAIVFSSEPKLQVQLPSEAQASGSGVMQGVGQGMLTQPRGSLHQPYASGSYSEQQASPPLGSGQGLSDQDQGCFNQPLVQQASTVSAQAELSTSTPQIRPKGRGQQPRTASGMQRQGWFQDDDSEDPNLHNPRDPDFERRNSGALASPSSPASPGPFDLARISGQVDAELQAQEEERNRLRQERMQRADRAAAAASAAIKADFKAKEDAESASKIDPKHALITLAAGLTVRYYLMDIIKVMVILAILLGDASFVVALFTRQHLSLELSLGIVFFTNIVLSLAALIYIVTGINTDIFVWAKDYLAALKEDDSAVNTKKDNTLSKLAAMEGAVPKQLQPAFKKVMQKLQQAGKKSKAKDKDDDDNSSADSLERSQSRYGDYDDENGGGSQGQPFTPRGRLQGPSGRSRVQFARRSSRGVGSSRRGAQATKSSNDKEDPKDYMSKAKQLWNYVGKFTGLETMGGGEQDTQELSEPGSGHSRSFGRQWTNSSTRSFKPGLGRSRLGRGSTPPGVADDYKSAAMLSRAEEGNSSVLHPQRVHSRARPVMRDVDSKNWGPTDRPDDAIPAKQAGGTDSEYAGLV
ncbi:hypothetical protein WJX79_010088 [Trebouxia sp. C0005]